MCAEHLNSNYTTLQPGKVEMFILQKLKHSICIHWILSQITSKKQSSPVSHPWSVLLALVVLWGEDRQIEGTLITEDKLISCCSSPSLQLNYYCSSSRHCQRAMQLIIMQIHQQLRNTHTHTHAYMCRLTSARTKTSQMASAIVGGF